MGFTDFAVGVGRLLGYFEEFIITEGAIGWNHENGSNLVSLLISFLKLSFVMGRGIVVNSSHFTPVGM